MRRIADPLRDEIAPGADGRIDVSQLRHAQARKTKHPRHVKILPLAGGGSYLVPTLTRR